MWLSEAKRIPDPRRLTRRATLASGLMALAGCGFAPVYGRQGTGNRLIGQIALSAPTSPNTHLFNRRFEERMGRASGPLSLSLRLNTEQQSLGTTSTGNTTRYRVLGRASFTLRDSAGAALTEGKTETFTGYSATGSTVATLAAERDARERLMLLLADQVIDELLLASLTLPE